MEELHSCNSSIFVNTANLHALFFEPPIEANAFGHILEEIYKSGLFNSVLPQKKEGSIVIDAGANVGLTSYYFSPRFEKVYSIEPSKRHFDVLNHMLEFNKITNVSPFQFALSMLDKKEENFYLYSNRTMDSLYGNIVGTGGLTQTGVEKVELKRLDTFIKEQNIDHVDLLKIDVEGVEFEILGSDSFSNVADKIQAVTCEIHSSSGRNPSQIIDALKINGFQVQVLPHDAQLVIARK